MPNAIEHARAAFQRRAWGEAYDTLAAAGAQQPLDAANQDRLAVAAYLTGHDEESALAWELGHQRALADGDTRVAFRCAFWLGMSLMNQGAIARGGGWLARASRLLDTMPEECVERGYLFIPQAIELLAMGGASEAFSAFEESARFGERYQDLDLTTMGRLGQGQSLVTLGEHRKGMPLLDEVMISVTTGEASPLICGIAYCGVIVSCREVFDLHRAQEWTSELSRWCDAQPGLVASVVNAWSIAPKSSRCMASGQRR